MAEAQDLGVVLYERAGTVARVVLNWPEKANAQSSEMVWQVDAALELAGADDQVKVVVLKANGNGFCAGHVTTGMDAYPEFVASHEAIGSNYIGSRRVFLWPTLRFFEFPKPMIAQVHGYALGGGTYWAFLPDITIASEDAYFQMPLVQGLGFPGGETMVEPWTFMNRKRAASLYTAQTLTAAEALEMGLINRVVPRERERRSQMRAPPLDADGDEVAARAGMGGDGDALAPPDVSRCDVDHGTDERCCGSTAACARGTADPPRGGRWRLANDSSAARSRTRSCTGGPWATHRRTGRGGSTSSRPTCTTSTTSGDRCKATTTSGSGSKP